MSDLLLSLALRTLAAEPAVRPRLRARFEPESNDAPPAREGTSRGEEPRVERRIGVPHEVARPRPVEERPPEPAPPPYHRARGDSALPPSAREAPPPSPVPIHALAEREALHEPRSEESAEPRVEKEPENERPAPRGVREPASLEDPRAFPRVLLDQPTREEAPDRVEVRQFVVPQPSTRAPDGARPERADPEAIRPLRPFPRRAPAQVATRSRGPLRAPEERFEAESPPVQVTIGRLEVRVVAAPAPAAVARAPRGPETLSLDEYLKRAAGAPER